MRKTVEAGLLTALALASVAIAEQPRPPQNITAPAKLPAFEVVSVQKDKSPEPLTRRFQTTADGVVIEGLTLKDLIAFAYGFGWNHILDGPNWINNAKFSIQAKVAESDVAALKAVTPQQRNQMLRPILEDRFHLRVHVETQTLPIFELVAAKGGPKISPLPIESADSSDLARRGRMLFYGNQIRAEGVPIRDITSALSNVVGRTVVDKTGMQGLYDFALHWSPEETNMAASPTNDVYPSIYGALKEQLGLELIDAKGSIDVLVIDHVEMPTSN